MLTFLSGLQRFVDKVLSEFGIGGNRFEGGFQQIPYFIY
jgi:hypothetical protein